MNGSYFQNIRHTLLSEYKEPLVIIDPIGYETSEEEFTRTFKNIGIVSNFSAQLTFVDDAKDYIIDIADNYGLNEVITIKKEGRDPFTDAWEELYASELDLMTIKIQEDQLSIKISPGGFDKLFQAREKEKIEVESTTSIDGVNLPSLQTKTLKKQARSILLQTEFERPETVTAIVMQDRKRTQYYKPTVSSAETLQFVHKEGKTQIQSESPFKETYISENSNQGTTGLMFFINAADDIDLDIEQLDVSFFYQAEQFTPSQGVDEENNPITLPMDAQFQLRFEIFSGEYNFYRNRSIPIWTAPPFQDNANRLETVSYSGVISLKKGESISLQFYQVILEEAPDYALLSTRTVMSDFNMITSHESKFEETNTEVLMIHELGERLTQHITGKTNRFKSSVLGGAEIGYPNDGDWSYLGTYCGHWLRGFNKNDDRYKPYTTSFVDFSSTLKGVFNIHTGFQTINDVEQVIAENFEYFFNPNVVLVLPNPLTKVSRSVAHDIIYSDVKGGYEKGGEVEDLVGLDEPNGKVNWISNIKTSNNSYNIRSKYIAGTYDEEKTRRKTKEISPTEDTNRDKDIYIKDLIKNVDGTIRERFWDDDFENKPTGVFSADTLTNARLSPANNIRRHSKLLSTPLKHYQNNFLSFGSSNSNSGMTTELIGKTPVLESENIPNSEFGQRMFEPYYIEGEHEVDIEIIKKIKGYSTFDGIDVPNFYCKVQFTLENDPIIRYGWIMSLKPDSSKWKFIEAANI